MSKLGTNKPVTARFRPWLELFFLAIVSQTIYVFPFWYFVEAAPARVEKLLQGRERLAGGGSAAQGFSPGPLASVEGTTWEFLKTLALTMAQAKARL